MSIDNQVSTRGKKTRVRSRAQGEKERESERERERERERDKARLHFISETSEGRWRQTKVSVQVTKAYIELS